MALVAVMGLPGSGKSTLCALLRELLVKQGYADVAVVDFDDAAVHDGDRDSVSEATWKEQRRMALAKVEALLQAPPCGEGAGNGDGNDAGSQVQRRDAVVIVDDTLHLRSMRRELFRIARQCGVGFGVIAVQTEVEECCQRDLARPQPVGAAVIHNMASRVELPAEAWEPSITVQNSSRCSKDEELAVQRTDVLKHCSEFLARTCSQPLTPYIDNTAAKAAARLATAKSLLHQTDLRLRGCVGNALKTATALSAEERRDAVSRISALKSSVLADLRAVGDALSALECEEAVTAFEAAIRDIVQP
ncbi:hypothetical protein PTSG_02035 [Salpingoeca rosetta]|uniref:AAA+ ATPase domain-containing protein n=1 Tax=Salpingoeca rosetta (strain ATCC 50818 / BSB-021) TaxID=946362 RepID=F2TZP3_SALR5|nr:uncharacterized protein PTSG_02035 [Salpingoeca rosetta]EGD79067.1 hypothetical protein PTSG_02035 [Salpingoeca rosetta]|eukprot:XP_004998023.1 hypothetical protein PTSG_02035 [Salpingoeca rosetta]